MKCDDRMEVHHNSDCGEWRAPYMCITNYGDIPSLLLTQWLAIPFIKSFESIFQFLFKYSRNAEFKFSKQI